MADKFQWNDELDAELRKVRSEGMAYRDCAEHFGIDESLIARRCREIGINQKMNRGRMSARLALNLKPEIFRQAPPVNDEG